MFGLNYNDLNYKFRLADFSQHKRPLTNGSLFLGTVILPADALCPESFWPFLALNYKSLVYLVYTT